MRCAVLCCSGVCCAALFRCVPLSASACRDALCAMPCAMLHEQRMAATATRATATLFHGGLVPATSEVPPRCRHTPVGGAGSKNPGSANENCAHFSSHLISCVRLRRLYGLGCCAALCCCNVCCHAPRCASKRHSALQCSILLRWVRVTLCCVLCCFAVRRCRPCMGVCCSALCSSHLVCSLSCIAVVRAAQRGPTALSASDSLNASRRPLRLSVPGDH